MGVSTYTHEVASPVAPSRMFKALFVDAHNFLPKLMPDSVKSIDVLHGDGGAGTINQMNYVEGGVSKFAKHKNELVDADNLVCKYSMIEGADMGDKIESIDYEVKFEAGGNGGCVCKTTSKYNTKGDCVLDEAKIKEDQDKHAGLFKAAEAYLLANPSVYA